MIIKTKFHHRDNNGAKITAWTVISGKRRQLTIDYPYQLGGEDKYRLAALRLHEKLFGIAATVAVNFVSECAEGAYKFTSMEQS